MEKYKAPAQYRLIYIFKINDEAHKGKLKIGKASLASTKGEKELPPNCEELNKAAIKRIKDEGGRELLVEWELLHTELAVRHIIMNDNTERQEDFWDHDVIKVIKKSGYEVINYEDSGKRSEWCVISLEDAKNAITAYKKGLLVIPYNGITSAENEEIKEKELELREEQERNVNQTIAVFKKDNKMLWDCKMRYGKTVTAYELIRRMGLKRVIVITHRPAVQDGWKEEHKLIFKGTNHRFIDKTNKKLEDFSEEIDSENDKMLYDLEEQKIPFIYFASIQDLRGSKIVGGKHNKNNKVFDTDWQLVIIDEAHEGIQTEIGEKVIEKLVKDNTKILSLSGTAYGLIKDFGNNIFTWTYVDEQKAKKEWDMLHPNEKNPYADLPDMNIFTFDLKEKIEKSYRYATIDSAFNFREFFRVWTGNSNYDLEKIPDNAFVGDFVHEDAVISFLNLITKDDESNNYPFSTEEYRNMFKHTFWIVPGVKEAKALSQLLRQHPVFSKYKIVNIAGDGDEEERFDKALHKVRKAINENERTITLSCGRLTTGVTVGEWTGIMMLSGSTNTSAKGYMQAIFRVQSPGVIEGKRKEHCYVFDFAPDRALKVVSEVHKANLKQKDASAEKQREIIEEFLKFCPVISVEGTRMKEYDVNTMMRQVKKISVERAINSGFDDNSIYLTDAGLKRDDIDEVLLKKLADIVYPQKRNNKNKKVILANNGLTEEQLRKIVKIKKKEEKELTKEEKELLEKEKQARKQQRKLFDLLRAISIRLPLLFYGAEADITQIIKLEDFVDIVDSESWQEFLPKGLSKELFLDISRYFDKDVLVGAGLRIREMAKAADEYLPNIRANKIFEILSNFKNPDKETVLTPWNIVNMHLSETIGGYVFFDENNNEIDEPIFIDRGEITKDIIFKDDAKVLEINSKSGLYPLYMAYSFYNYKIKGNEKEKTIEELRSIWNKVLNENIYVLCKTKMARSIAIRTLAGYTGEKVNAIYLTKLVNERTKYLDRLTNKLTNPSTWGKEGERLKFDAVIGNPPYQGNNHQQIYTDFYLASRKLGTYSSLIFPTGWQEPKNANNLSKLNNEEIKTDKQIMYIDNRQNVFPGIAGAEWVNIMLWKKNYDNKLEGKQRIYTNGKDPKEIKLIWNKEEIEKPKEIEDLVQYVTKAENFESMQSYVSSLKPYGLRTDFFNDQKKYKLPSIQNERIKETDILIYGIENRKQTIKYIPEDYPLPKVTNAYNKYKVLIGKAWGNFSEGYLGGAYADIIIAAPNEICTENFLECGIFDTYEDAKKHSKYLMTKFVRALLFALKNSQDNSKDKWKYIPKQGFEEEWWNLSIEEINKKLYEKYNIPSEICEFIEKNIQPKDETNIINYK